MEIRWHWVGYFQAKAYRIQRYRSECIFCIVCVCVCVNDEYCTMTTRMLQSMNTFIHGVDITQLDFIFAFTHLKLHYLLSRCSVQLPWQLQFYNHWAMKTKVPKQSEKLLFFSKCCSVQLINHSKCYIAVQF